MPSMGVGVALIRINPDSGETEFLVGQRSHNSKRGAGVHAMPGGVIEPGEGIQAAAARELYEETGIEICFLKGKEYQQNVYGVTDHRPREDHLTFWVVALAPPDQEPRVMEPEKQLDWRWTTMSVFFGTIPQEGEQVHWSNFETWNRILTLARRDLNNGIIYLG